MPSEGRRLLMWLENEEHYERINCCGALQEGQVEADNNGRATRSFTIDVRKVFGLWMKRSVGSLLVGPHFFRHTSDLQAGARGGGSSTCSLLLRQIELETSLTEHNYAGCSKFREEGLITRTTVDLLAK